MRKPKSGFPNTFIKKVDGKDVVYASVSYINKDGKKSRLTRKLDKVDYQTVAQVIAELTESVKIVKNDIVTPESATFGQVALRWLERRKMTVREYTALVYERQLKTHIIAHIGHLKITEISHQHIQNIVNNLYHEKKFRLIEAVKILTNSVLQYAVDFEFIKDRKFMKKVIYPKRPFKESLAMTQDELKRFLEVSNLQPLSENKHWSIFFELFAKTGCRPSEIIGLTWDYVDFTNNLIQIRKVVSMRLHNQIKFEAPKTKRSIRDLPLTQSTMERLKEWKEFSKNRYNPYNFVFPSRKGRFIKDTVATRAMKSILKQAELNPNFSLKTFRHSLISIMLQNGVNIKVVASRAGDTEKTILEHYAHLLALSQVEVSEKLDTWFS